MTAIRTFFQEFWNRIPQIGVNDIIDILIVAFLFYTVMRLIRSTSAARIARSILLLLVVTGLTEIFKLYTLNWILSKILEIGVIALVIMFQPELRRMLERFGGRFFSNLISSSGSASPEQQAIEATVAACEVMSKEKVGALLIFERSMPLDEYFKTGTIIDAKVTDQLLRNLFFKNSPLHDGAVIVRGSRVAAAGCVMPLSENTHLPGGIGTRHRAGIGTSELREMLGVPYDFIAENLLRSARKFSGWQLEEAVRLCAQTDFAMKSTGADDTELLKELLLRIAVGGAA